MKIEIVSQAITGAIFQVMKGMLIPLFIGMGVWAFKYPLGAYDCYAYGQAKGLDSKYVWFECYVKDKDTKWLTQREYQSSVVGSKIIMMKGIEE